MAKVVVEVNSTTNIVEKIYPYAIGMNIDPEPGRYAVPNVPDNIVALGFVCDRTTTPATFAPNPNPPATEADMATALEKLDQGIALQAEARAMIETLRG